ncbi:hypothetical protein AMATHDRAFT_2291 [Amanita thiersii Skay4041]|uniref:Uncharacterized protein n=1 Tax=Amanita thiersii Skay4041 TaxID=703135 RepID=A0A2A9NVH7_9AGAR|nr:hypothetical protein AMATHDRAFT_2291 [Amanita thiersii Skay4041]
MDTRVHGAFVNTAGFCFALVGFILSVLSAVVSAVITTNRRGPLLTTIDGGVALRPERIKPRSNKSRSRSPLSITTNASRLRPTPLLSDYSQRPLLCNTKARAKNAAHRRKGLIPTITMTIPDDEFDTSEGILHQPARQSSDPLPTIETVLSTVESRNGQHRIAVNTEVVKPILHRSISSPELSSLPDSTFLRPPSPSSDANSPQKRSLLRKVISVPGNDYRSSCSRTSKKDQSSQTQRARTRPYEAPYNIPTPDSY